MKQIKIACESAKTIPHTKLIPFQDDLKILQENEYEQLREIILTQGFSAPISVWQDNGKYYIINGHQRLETIKRLEKEGYKIPHLPVSIVAADSWQQAKEKVLGATSVYGELTQSSLAKYTENSKFEMDQVMANFRHPTVEAIPQPVPMEEAMSATTVSFKAKNIKQIILSYPNAVYADMLRRLDMLQAEYGVSNSTEVLMRLIDEAD